MKSKGLQGIMSQNDVNQLLELIQKLEESSFDYLKLETEDLKLVISKGEWAVTDLNNPGAVHQGSSQMSEPGSSSHRQHMPTQAHQEEGNESELNVVRQDQQPEQRVDHATSAEETVVIPAPTAGLFYAQSEPGAPPYVKVGDHVQEDTTVGLIEIMKVFNAVTAGVKGVITEICVENAQFVEYGQPLFRVKPDQSDSK